MSDFYKFRPSIRGQAYDMDQLRGKVVCVVNVASKCALALQYPELQQLYERYRDQGFEVLAFPCSQFGAQEFESQEEIIEYCTTKYGVTYPLFDKVEVNGPMADELFSWLKLQKAGFLGFSGIKWNFEKFLIDRNGTVVGRWQCHKTPLELESTIQELL